MTNLTMNLIQIAMLLTIIGMLLRAMSLQRRAVRTARDTKSDAATTATNANTAACASRVVLDRVDATSDKNNVLSHRIENAATVVAQDLAAAKERADSTLNTEFGAAADAAAMSPRYEEDDDRP